MPAVLPPFRASQIPNELRNYVQQYDYNEAGNIMKTIHQATDDNTTTEVSQKRYRYCGKERDEESGLYYYGARYSAAWLCRFVSVDPLKDDYPYYTPFQYAGNKPITFIDLDGLEPASNPIINVARSEELDHQAFSDSKKESRSVDKYARKFNQMRDEYLSNNNASNKTAQQIDNSVHKLMNDEYGGKRWMWIKNKNKEDSLSSHGSYFNAGELYKWYNTSETDRYRGIFTTTTTNPQSMTLVDPRNMTNPGVTTAWQINSLTSGNTQITASFNIGSTEPTTGSSTVRFDLRTAINTPGSVLRTDVIPGQTSYNIQITLNAPSSSTLYIGVTRLSGGLSKGQNPPTFTSVTIVNSKPYPSQYEVTAGGKNLAKNEKGKTGKFGVLQDKYSKGKQNSNKSYNYASIIKDVYNY